MGKTEIGGNKESFRAIGNLDLNCHKEQQSIRVGYQKDNNIYEPKSIIYNRRGTNKTEMLGQGGLTR